MQFPKYNIVPVIGRFRWCLEILKSQTTKNKILVDIGCSTGLMESKLVDLSFKKIIAFDPSNNAVAFAKKNIRNKKIQFTVSTADNIPAKNSLVDLVTIFDVIEHVPKNTEPEVFNEIARVLKKNGKMLLTTPNSDMFTNLLDPAWYLGHRHYDPQNLKGIIEKSGLKVTKIEIRGSIWSSVYMLWFYIMKWIFGKSLPRWQWIEKKEDQGYNEKGIFTLFIEAKK